MLGLSGKAPFLPLVLAMAMEYWDSESPLIGIDSEKPQPLVRIMGSARLDDLTWWQNTGILQIPVRRRGPLAVQDRQMPKAMICIGIDAHVIENALTFAKVHNGPAQIIAAPGGYARELAKILEVRPYDEAFMSRVNDWRPQWYSMAMQKSSAALPKDEEAFVPYRLLMQSLVEHLTAESSQTE